jgi:hypothetical protein
MVAGIIFSIFAIMHLLRLIYHWKIIIAGSVIPMSVSGIALIVAVILAVWMFSAAKCCK